MKRITEKIKGLNLVIIKTDKFKTTDFVLNFRSRLQPNKVTTRALIPQILKSASANYPTKQAISQKLEALYGASFGVSVNKQGILHILTFRMSIVNDNYLQNNATLLDDSFEFFRDILFNPRLENGVFSEKVINEEKRLLKEQFQSLYDDKIRYAYDRLIDEMCKTENYRIKSLGRVEDIDNITPNSLYEEYQAMLNNDTIDMLIIGDIDEKRVKVLVEKYLHFEKREEIKDVVDSETKEIRNVEKIVESKDVNQAKLNMGFRTNITGADDDYYPLLLMNGMLGVYPHSLLFRNVREKESLCYYIASNIDKGKGIMIIYAGINKKDFEKAYDITLKQIETLKTGDYEESLLTNTRNALINDLLQLSDNPIAFLSSEYSHLLYQETFDTDRIMKKLNKVSKKDIERVAQKLTLDTVFLLTNEEEVNK